MVTPSCFKMERNDTARKLELELGETFVYPICLGLLKSHIFKERHINT